MRAQSPRLNSAINPKKACQAALANALVSTPDPLKVQVLWELYWLLRRQDSIRCVCYWGLRLKLLARQRELQAQPLVGGEPQGPDFYDQEPQTPRAVLAALFVLELQYRRPLPRPGHGLTFRELVRIASAPHSAHVVRELDCPEVFAMAPPTVVGFLASPLCHDGRWIPEQFSVHSPYPFLPRRTWEPLEGAGAPPRPVSPPVPHVDVVKDLANRHQLRTTPKDDNCNVPFGHADGGEPTSPQRFLCPRDRHSSTFRVPSLDRGCLRIVRAEDTGRASTPPNLSFSAHSPLSAPVKGRSFNHSPLSPTSHLTSPLRPGRQRLVGPAERPATAPGVSLRDAGDRTTDPFPRSSGGHLSPRPSSRGHAVPRRLPGVRWKPHPDRL
eukprot:EG_transcript_4885